MPSPIDSKTLLAEIDALCQTQIIRISKQLQLNPNSLKANVGDRTITAPDADATPVSHAVGKRKPSLEDLDQMPPPARLSRPRRR